MVLGIACPALVGLMALGGRACLWALRPHVPGRESPPAAPMWL